VQCSHFQFEGASLGCTAVMLCKLRVGANMRGCWPASCLRTYLSRDRKFNQMLL
jgi:hypothetical protein